MSRLDEIRLRQQAIRARQQEIRTELLRIEALPEPTDTDGDEAARAQILADRSATLDEQIAEFDLLEQEFGTLATEATPLQERADRLERVRSAALETVNREPGSQPGNPTNGAPAVHRTRDPFADLNIYRAEPGDLRDRAMQVLDNSGRIVNDSNRARLEEMFEREDDDFRGEHIAARILMTENPAYRSAFQKYIRRGVTAALTPEEQHAVANFQDWSVRAASEANASGGYGLPVLIDPTIILTSGAADNPVLNICRVETITTNAWKGVTSAAPAWSWDAEAAEVSDDMTTLAQPSVSVFMARGFIPYSIEIGSDYPNFAAQMSDLISQGYLDLIVSTLATGSGSSQPRGVFTALDATSASEVLLTTAGSFGAVDVFNAWNALPERFRRNASWFMNVSVESQIRQFANNANNTAYFTVDLTADGISRINGRPVYLSDYAPAWLATTAHQNRLVCGDFKAGYLIAQRAGMTLEQIPMLFSTGNGRPTGQRGWFAWARSGADVVVSNALRLLNQT